MRRYRHLIILIMAILAGTTFYSCEVQENSNNSGNVKPETETPETDKPETDIPEDADEFVILFTNDFHSQIEPISETATYNKDRGGVKRIKALVDSIRKAEPIVYLADAGDLVQGTYYFSLLNGVVEMMMLDELEYDVRTIGNHEFDKKMTGLGDMLALSKVPVVATNYDFSKTSIAHHVRKSAIIEKGGLKIGFIGLNVRLENLVDPTACEGVEWQNAINVADDEAKKLRDQGADMVIALSHLGYERDSDAFYYDKGLIRRTKNIDMLIGGHSHTFLMTPDYVTDADGDKVPVVQTGCQGIYLGYAKIKFDDKGKPSFRYKLIPVNSRLDSKIDKDFSDIIDVYSATVTEKMSEVIGNCPYAIRKGNPESPLGNLTADGLIWMAKEYYNVDADVSLYNTGGIRAEISKGELTLGDVYAVYPFDNVLSVLTLKGKDMKTLFDHVASGGGMPVNKAVKLVISNNKVKSVTINGQPIDENKTYKVATIDYLVNTGRYGLDNAITRNDSAEIIRDWFGEYFRHLSAQNNGKITAAKDGRITIE